MDLMGPLLGYILSGFPIAHEERPGPALAFCEKWVVTEKPLPESSNLLPQTATERVLLFKSFWGTLCSSSRAADIGNWKQRSNEAHHPVVGIGDVVEEIEMKTMMQFPGCEISFYLPEREHATLHVFSVDGRIVRQLVDEQLDDGVHEARWDGTDSDGNSVSSGVFFYALEAGQWSLTKRMVLLK